MKEIKYDMGPTISQYHKDYFKHPKNYRTQLKTLDNAYINHHRNYLYENIVQLQVNSKSRNKNFTI